MLINFSRRAVMSLALLASAACSQTQPDSAISANPVVPAIVQLDAVFTNFHEAGQFNGAAVVMNEGQVLWSGEFGLADIGDNAPITQDTSFELASLTKTFLGLVIMDLVEDGLLDLNAPVIDYIRHPRASILENVTLINLLSHTSGLKREVFENSDDLQVEHSRDEILTSILGEPLTYEPGSEYAYSNAGYVLARLIAEEVSGISFGELLEARVFAPAGMQESGLAGDARSAELLASGYDILVGDPVPASNDRW